MKVKIRFIKDVNVNIDGRSIRCKIDEVLSVDKSIADDMKNGGYAVGTRATAKIKTQPKGKPLTTKNVKGR